jgi:hypothetical protein
MKYRIEQDDKELDELFATNVNIPLGLDWRFCCWSLDDAKRIWGEE